MVDRCGYASKWKRKVNAFNVLLEDGMLLTLKGEGEQSQQIAFFKLRELALKYSPEGDGSADVGLATSFWLRLVSLKVSR